MDPGFEISGTYYPFPVSFRLGDPVLVEQVTGLSWPEFTNRLDDSDYDEDLVTLSGLIAVSLWQQNPGWRRDRVVREVERLDMENVKVVGDEVEPSPPAEAEANLSEQASATSANGSSSTPASEQEPESQPTTGQQDSTTGAPDLHRVA
jgi:hypothetical protein